MTVIVAFVQEVRLFLLQITQEKLDDQGRDQADQRRFERGRKPAGHAKQRFLEARHFRAGLQRFAEVPNGLRMAGTALGMTPPQSLRLVLLPLALPTLLAGVRTATSIAIGTATIAAFIGAGGFGERIVTGLALNDRELLVAGALPAAALALLSEGLFELVEYLMRRRRRVPPSSLPS